MLMLHSLESLFTWTSFNHILKWAKYNIWWRTALDILHIVHFQQQKKNKLKMQKRDPMVQRNILPSCTAWKGLLPSTNSTEMVIFSVSKISLFKLRSATARRNTSSSFRADSSKMAPIERKREREQEQKSNRLVRIRKSRLKLMASNWLLTCYVLKAHLEYQFVKVTLTKNIWCITGCLKWVSKCGL